MATETPEAYARQLKALLPRGAVWLFDQGSVLSQLLLALGDEFSRIAARARDLVEEADPRTATETLDEWERMLGLPDGCVIAVPSTTAERRLAITQAFIRVGGQRDEYFIALAAACGYTATVYDDYGSTVFRAGMRVGVRLVGVDWSFAWRMDIQAPTGTALTHAELECIIRRAAPSHTTVIFNYL